ncbi:MAG: ATP-binding protein, partial [Arthrobacter sp.]
MVNRLHLVHLTAVGTNVPPATIEFGDRLTVIHGASDTGKSHIFDLLNYVFGITQSIELPNEAKGYQYVHLGIRTAEGNILTLVRDFTGGRIGLIPGDRRELMTTPAPEYLAPKHISKDPRSVSRYLLSLTDLDESVVRTNQHNETRPLQWRDVVRLAAVDEETILTKRSPIEFGQYRDRPVEAAIFRMFIEGQDDSGLTPIPKAAEMKKISANKLEILDQVITDLEQELADSPPADQLRDQLVRLNDSLVAASRAMNEVSSKRDKLVLRRAANTKTLAGLVERQDELASLEARFGLLHAQYESDLSRLEMLAQASDVLAVDETGSCPLCGANPVHQHWPESQLATDEPVMFAAAIASEQHKIMSLSANLEETISSIQAERHETTVHACAISDDNVQLTAQIRRLDTELETPGEALAPLLEARSRVEREIDAHNRLLNLLALRTETGQVDKPKTSTEVPITSGDLHQFDTVAQEILRQWSFSEDGTVHYSTSERDLVVDQRVRRVRGKGVRSILRALFNVALAEYCLRRGY